MAYPAKKIDIIGKVIRVSPDNNASESPGEKHTYTITYNDYQMVIDEIGNVGIRNLIANKSYKLFIEDQKYIDRLNYTVYGNSLVIVYSWTGLEWGGDIISIDLNSLELNWKEAIPAGNIGNCLADKNFLYITGCSFISKYNMVTGNYIWMRNDLSEKYNIMPPLVKTIFSVF